MSFLIVFNGQFTPYIHSIAANRNTIVPVDPSKKLDEIEDFKEVLQGTDKETNTRPPSLGIKAYQQVSKKFEAQKKRHYARDIMSTPVQKISETSSVREARELFKKHGFRHLPVVNSELIIIGMISDREMNGASDTNTCKEIMLDKVIVCEVDASIPQIALILLNEKINALPIIDHHREVQGIITLSDILKHVIQTSPFLGRA
jgi:CBS domain-containing protein